MSFIYVDNADSLETEVARFKDFLPFQTTRAVDLLRFYFGVRPRTIEDNLYCSNQNRIGV